MRGINDVYIKSATVDRSISVGCGYGNNDPAGYTNDKEITEYPPLDTSSRGVAGS